MKQLRCLHLKTVTDDAHQLLSECSLLCKVCVIFLVVQYNVSFQAVIRYLSYFILHRVEIQHTNYWLR